MAASSQDRDTRPARRAAEPPGSDPRSGWRGLGVKACLRHVGTSRAARQGGHAEGVRPPEGAGVGWSERIEKASPGMVHPALQ